ncbi:MAG: FAD-dependent oxidoreductase [Sporomusaceae bacterium]|nr:FAD-dependent oxidoreductase [Sporomusaceae bacterium]
MSVTTEAKVEKINYISDSIREFVLIPQKYKKFEPGQFLQLAFGIVENHQIWPDSRAFSIASHYDKDYGKINIVVKREKNFTTKMFKDLKEGSIATIRYPFGDFLVGEGDRPKVFIAAGTGITPFLSYFGSADFETFNSDINLYYVAKDAMSLIHFDKLEHLSENHKNFHAKYYLTKETNRENSKFNYKRIEIEDIIVDVLSTDFYISGPKDFIMDLTTKLKKQGVDTVYSEEWT